MKTLEPLITNYLKTGEYVRKLSSNTIKAYRTDLTQYSYFVGSRWNDTGTLNQYIEYLNQHFSPRSVKRKLASIHAFFNEMTASGHLTANPFDKVHAPNLNRNCQPHTFPQGGYYGIDLHTMRGLPDPQPRPKRHKGASHR